MSRGDDADLDGGSGSGGSHPPRNDSLAMEGLELRIVRRNRRTSRSDPLVMVGVTPQRGSEGGEDGEPPRRRRGSVDSSRLKRLSSSDAQDGRELRRTASARGVIQTDTRGSFFFGSRGTVAPAPEPAALPKTIEGNPTIIKSGADI